MDALDLNTLITAPVCVYMDGKTVCTLPVSEAKQDHVKYVCYYRVSTAMQARLNADGKADGNGLQAQRDGCRAFAAQKKAVILAEVQEVVSGRSTMVKREALLSALDICEKTKATLLFLKVDRLARSTLTISLLKEKNVPLCIVENPDASLLLLDILAAFAENEARNISARTKAALDAKKARGWVRKVHPTAPRELAVYANLQKNLKYAKKYQYERNLAYSLRGHGMSVNAIAQHISENTKKETPAWQVYKWLRQPRDNVKVTREIVENYKPQMQRKMDSYMLTNAANCVEETQKALAEGVAGTSGYRTLEAAHTAARVRLDDIERILARA